MKEYFILKWSYITNRIVLFGVQTYLIYIVTYLAILRYFEIFFFCKIKLIGLQRRFT